MACDEFISYGHDSDFDLAPAVHDELQRLARRWKRAAKVRAVLLTIADDTL
jgi:hypothetical protein